MSAQEQQKRITDCRRLIGVFGLREVEIAAILILDTQWDRPFDPVNKSIFADDAREGFALLKRWHWIADDNIPTRAFWAKVHGR